MKNFRQLIKELPSKKVVMAFGRFQPPTTGHELLVNAVKKIAQKQSADYVIFASRTQDKKTNPLPVDRKVYYLKRMFPKTNFIAANEEVRTFIEAATVLSKKYKHLVMVAGSDRVSQYEQLLNRYNGEVYKFDTIEVVSAGERDPDSDNASGMSGTKMRDAAKKGDFSTFRKGLPHTLTELDGKRLMNEIRQGMGMDSIKEQVKFEVSKTREMYHSGEIFKLEEIVESAGVVYQIKKRGSNHLLLQDETGALVSKWLNDVQYTDKDYNLQEGTITEMKFSASDKIKVARVIAGALGVEDVEKSSNPEQLVNNALRKVRNKPMKPEYISVIHNMLQTAKEADIKFDEKLVPQKVEEEVELTETEQWEFKKIHGEYKNLKSKPTSDVHKIHMGLHRVTSKYTPAEVGGKQGMIDDIMHHRHGEKRMTAYHALPKKHKDSLSEELSKIIEDIANAKMLGKNTKDLENKLSTVRGNIVTDPKKTVDSQVNNTSDVEAEEEPIAPTGSEVGSSMTSSAESPAARKMKIRYVHEDAESTTEDDEEDVGPDSSSSKLTKTSGIQEEEESTEEDKELDKLSDKDLDKMVDTVDELDDIIDAYEDDELAIIDSETGEHVQEIKEENEIINEVLSRIERMRAKTRFAKSAAKRERKLRVALKSRSSNATINARARKLAVKLMKQKIARKPLAQLSVGEKERIEKTIQRRKVLINRLAMKLAPRVRKIESMRLSHDKFTKPAKA